jgi:hypothetical protein
MISSAAKRKSSEQHARIRVYQPAAHDAQSAFWRINGFRARLVIWTIEQWDSLEARPTDAQYHPSGFWCALRVE